MRCWDTSAESTEISLPDFANLVNKTENQSAFTTFALHQPNSNLLPGILQLLLGARMAQNSTIWSRLRCSKSFWSICAREVFLGLQNSRRLQKQSLEQRRGAIWLGGCVVESCTLSEVLVFNHGCAWSRYPVVILCDKCLQQPCIDSHHLDRDLCLRPTVRAPVPRGAYSWCPRQAIILHTCSGG